MQGRRSLWNALLREVKGTVEEFREKGAKGVILDAALDARDIIVSTGGALVDALSPDSGAELLVEASPDGVLPNPGDHVTLRPSNEDVEVIAVDTISSPPRLRIRCADQQELVVPIRPLKQVEAVAPSSEIAKDTAGQTSDGNGILDELGKELRSTVEEIKEKGLVNTLKVAALETADMIGSAAGAALDGAKHIAGKTKGLLTIDEEEEKQQEDQQQDGEVVDPSALDDWYQDDQDDTDQDDDEQLPLDHQAEEQSVPEKKRMVPGLGISKLKLPQPNLDEPEVFTISTARA